MPRMQTRTTPKAHAKLGLVGALSLLALDASPATLEEPQVRGPRHWDECRAAGVAAAPAVFRKGDQIRFYLGNGSWQVALKGHAESKRKPSSDYEFQIVQLKYAPQPPPQPETKQGWDKADRR